MKSAVLKSLRGAATTRWLGGKMATLAHHVLLAHAGQVGEPERNGEYELVRRALRVLGGEGRLTVFDVGANIGDWTGFVRESSSVPVEAHLFEPTPASFGRLASRFGQSREVHLNELALSSRGGVRALTDYGGTSGLNSLVDEALHPDSRTRRSVTTATGDAYCAERGINVIDLLKVDVEGHEWEVVDGFSRMLQGRRVRILQFEYGYANAVTRRLMRDFFALFDSLDYVVGPVRPSGPEFRPFRRSDDDFTSGPNFVAALPEIAAQM